MDHPSPPPRPRARRSAIAPLLIALALSTGLAACGGGNRGPVSSTPVRRPGSSTSKTSTAPGTTTTTTTTATTTPLPGAGKPAVTIGDKNFDEQFVLGQLYLQALRAQGFKVTINQGIGPTSVVLGSLRRHTLAMYPEYLNVINETFEHRRQPPATLADAYASASSWATRHGLVLLTQTPFSDTTGVAVTDAFAAKHHLSTLGELLRVANFLYLGGALQFKRGGLIGTYGVAPLKFVPLAVGFQYSALDTGAVQAAYVTTTDGELATGDYRVLGDPLHVFGYGNVVPVLTQKAYDEEGPAFAATIDRVDRTLTLRTMRELNYAVDVAKLTPASVAQQFLQTHGLLTPLPPGSY